MEIESSLPNRSEAHTLLNHLITTPNLSTDLETLHALALYDSGDALLGPDEKEALLNIARLAWMLKRITRAELRLLRRQLRHYQRTQTV